MKTIVVSDLHLTDKFEPKKFEFLKNLFTSCDKLIVNGDLWCGFSTTFENFLNSEWNKLFPIMLEKQTIYIHGNHDHKEFIDDRYKLFAKELTKAIKIKNDTQNFIITHGHEFFRVTNLKNINLAKVIKRQKFKKKYYAFMNKFIFKTIGVKKIFTLFKFLNRKIYKQANKLFQENAIIVTGHTHLPEFRPDRGYINTGFIFSGLAWYLEINDSSTRLHSTKY